MTSANFRSVNQNTRNYERHQISNIIWAIKTFKQIPIVCIGVFKLNFSSEETVSARNFVISHSVRVNKVCRGQKRLAWRMLGIYLASQNHFWNFRFVLNYSVGCMRTIAVIHWWIKICSLIKYFIIYTFKFLIIINNL